MKKKYKVNVSVQLEYIFNAKDKEEARVMVENVELPSSYKEDSFELDSIEEYKD